MKTKKKKNLRNMHRICCCSKLISVGRHVVIDSKYLEYLACNRCSSICEAKIISVIHSLYLMYSLLISSNYSFIHVFSVKLSATC